MRLPTEPSTTHCDPTERFLTPKLLIGMIDGEIARALEQHFKAQGWRVCAADSTAEIRRKAHGGRAAAVVLPVTAFLGESAFLTCAKLVRSLPKVRVVLVGPASEECERFALFAGAAGYVSDTASASVIAKLVQGRLGTKLN